MSSYLLAPCVEGELWEIWTFIAEDSQSAATELVEAAFATFAALAANPRMGRARKFGGDRLRGIRSIHVIGYHNYLVFYRVLPEGVQILHVYHGARDLDLLFDGA